MRLTYCGVMWTLFGFGMKRTGKFGRLKEESRCFCMCIIHFTGSHEFWHLANFAVEEGLESLGRSGLKIEGPRMRCAKEFIVLFLNVLLHV